MRKKTLLSILVGIGALALMVTAYRANERRFLALRKEMRAVAEESRQRGEREVVLPAYALAAPAVVPNSPIPAPPPPESPAGSDADDPTRQPTGQGVTEEDLAVHVDVAFSEETSDSAWARQAERSIDAALRSIARSSTLENVECRATLCKASLRHPDEKKFGEFLDRLSLAAHELWTGAFYGYRESIGADGVVRNALYFAKQGHSIPSPE